MAPIQLPKIYYQEQSCIVDFRLGEMRCQDLDKDELKKPYFIPEPYGVPFDLTEKGEFRTLGLNPNKPIKTIKFIDLKEDKNSEIKKQLRGLRSKYWHNDYIRGVDD